MINSRGLMEVFGKAALKVSKKLLGLIVLYFQLALICLLVWVILYLYPLK